MTIPLLKTKLYIPTARSKLLSRPRLIECLNAGLQGKLTLISAPAGFGKTTLLSEWIVQRGDEAISTLSVAWLSLDKGDDAPRRFWTYVVAALQSVLPGIGEATLSAIQSSPPSSPLSALADDASSPLSHTQAAWIEAALTLLINEIAEAPGQLVLVLDDYHLIEADLIHDGVAFLLGHLPQNMHLIIASRGEPPLPLARLRGRGQLTELGEAELRFTIDEAATFLNQMIGLGLSTKEVGALVGRTEGWITGLQLAALSMRGREDVSGFIAAFTGSHRYVLDYLVQEVLHRQPQDVQTFLLQTSILDRLTGPLCDALTGHGPDLASRVGRPESTEMGNGQKMLERLEAADLFIVPLDDERRWYRYHRLFADLLRNQLEERWPGLLPTLHRQASLWYEKKDLLSEAIGHAWASGDIERVAHLVEGNVVAVMDYGELPVLVGWLDTLPEEMVRSRPWLAVSHAWALMYTGQLDAVERRLQDAENALTDVRQRDDAPALDMTQTMARIAEGGQGIQSYMATMRAYLAASRGEMDRAIELAHQALQYLPTHDSMVRGFAAAVLSSGYRYRGDLEAATQAVSEAVAISQGVDDSHMAVLTSCNLAGLLVQQGQLRRAATIFQEVLPPAERDAGQANRRLPFAGLACTGLATVLREWNDLESAERLAREGLELSRRWGQAEVLMHGHLELAQVLQARRDEIGALEAIKEAGQLARGVASLSVADVSAVEARLHLAQGNLMAASFWAQESGLRFEDDLSFQRTFLYITLTRVLMAEGRLTEALGILGWLLETAEAANANGYVIEILILQALTLQAQGKIDQALNSLERALVLAEPEGYVRIFVGEGAPMAALLQAAVSHGILSGYVNKLSVALGAEMKGEGQAEVTPSLSVSGSSSMVEPLSEREVEVLRLVAAGKSNREIADELFLAVGTVKKHLNNIYGKLGVRRRTQAVARARELDML